MKNKFDKIEDKNDNKMPLTMRNYVLMLIGVALIILGFVLMAGGTKATPEVFSEDIFSWRRITLAPILVVAGFAFEIYAILKRF
jgi:membrane-bound ClpP family serine protease